MAGGSSSSERTDASPDHQRLGHTGPQGNSSEGAEGPVQALSDAKSESGKSERAHPTQTDRRTGPSTPGPGPGPRAGATVTSVAARPPPAPSGKPSLSPSKGRTHPVATVQETRTRSKRATLCRLHVELRHSSPRQPQHAAHCKTSRPRLRPPLGRSCVPPQAQQASQKGDRRVLPPVTSTRRHLGKARARDERRRHLQSALRSPRQVVSAAGSKEGQRARTEPPSDSRWHQDTAWGHPHDVHKATMCLGHHQPGDTRGNDWT